jgi:hypothetical protein
MEPHIAIYSILNKNLQCKEKIDLFIHAPIRRMSPTNSFSRMIFQKDHCFWPWCTFNMESRRTTHTPQMQLLLANEARLNI